MQPTFVDQFSQSVDLRPSSTALVIVDMQNATGNRQMGLGKLLAETGRADSSAYRFDRIETLLIPRISQLAGAFRQCGARVIYITYGANLPDCSDVPRHMAGIIKATNNIAGQPEHEIVGALRPETGELVLNKTTQGAFRSTSIDTQLRAMGIETVVCVGVSTNNCVAMTAMEACDSQYGVVVVSDATATDSEEMQDATLNMLRRLWARVMTTDEVIAELTGEQRTAATG
ncbi:MAG: isochorismatase family cysteine hydrolase [Gammaproteobacteria bacterium]|nr:isochorismatase family cysteine hydrolase [Gammaproteobacteria bacterium]